MTSTPRDITPSSVSSVAGLEPSVSERAAIEIDGLFHTYARRGERIDVLRGVSLRVKPGAYISLVGPSGSGKSTLLSVLGGLERPQLGSVVVGGTVLTGLSGDALARFRLSTVGFVFQHFGLLDALTAAENIELALALAGANRATRRRRAVELLQSVGLGGRSDHRPFELSGGERQRVAIARAIANGPKIILADEPTGNLDVDSANAVMELLGSLRREQGTTLVIVTHNPVIAALAETHYRLTDGSLVSAADPQIEQRPDDGVG
ncbi:MAG TPA: ABC transporter ATP-binding protein [Acidimicrobiales bacterium]|jgi:putative ABC transport system ATP-binding protein|nr:ABC transporter ATP-binding protein [Acidimicrobiales bacterium]